MGRPLVNKRLLNGVRFFRSPQALQRRDLLLFHGADWHYAGANCLSSDDDRAGPALRQTATELGSTHVQFIAEYIQQWGFRIDVHGMNVTVDLQRNSSHHLTPSHSRLSKLTTDYDLHWTGGTGRTPRQSTAALATPSLTTVRQPLARMGEVAAQTLLERIAGRHDYPSEIAIEPELVVRESTAEAPRV